MSCLLDHTFVLFALRYVPISFCLLSCGDSQQKQTFHSPIDFASGDECHVCGMLIVNLPGPKGQAFDTRSVKMKKFCSTVDLISWYLQPENKPNVAEIYVHDMTDSNWKSPDDAKLVDAKKAFFVINSKRKGSMGKTISSFATKISAEQFVSQWGGSIVNFEQLSIAVIFEQ